MANKTPVEPEAAASEPTQLTLTEFCKRLSETNRRYVLIGGFYASEEKAGRVKDTEAAFNARFVEFTNKPA